MTLIKAMHNLVTNPSPPDQQTALLALTLTPTGIKATHECYDDAVWMVMEVG